MLPLVNDAYENLMPYVPGKPVSETERELGISGCVKLASNENPYGPSPLAVQAMGRALGSMHEYPDGGAYYLKQRIAKFHGVQVNQIIVGNGSNELIEMIVRTCLRPGENMLYADPSFIAYKLVAQAAGAMVKAVPLRDMRFDLAALQMATDQATKLIFLANPNNPTGTYVTRHELQDFLQTLPQDVLVVLDEAYFEYATALDYPDGMQLLAERERLMVLRTFSKCYGLAGLRIGYAVGHGKLIDYLNRGRQPFNVGTLAQVAATAALDDTEFVTRCRQHNRAEMDKLVPQLQQRGLAVVPSQANFVLVDFHAPAPDIFQALLQQGVIVRPMHGQGLRTWQRVTVGTAAENARLLQAIDSVAKG